jgi:hypothetical protein
MTIINLNVLSRVDSRFILNITISQARAVALQLSKPFHQSLCIACLSMSTIADQFDFFRFLFVVHLCVAFATDNYTTLPSLYGLIRLDKGLILLIG